MNEENSMTEEPTGPGPYLIAQLNRQLYSGSNAYPEEGDNE